MVNGSELWLPGDDLSIPSDCALSALSSQTSDLGKRIFVTESNASIAKGAGAQCHSRQDRRVVFERLLDRLHSAVKSLSAIHYGYCRGLIPYCFSHRYQL